MSTRLNTFIITTAVISLLSASLAFGQPCGGKGRNNMASRLNLDEQQQNQVQQIMQQQRTEAQAWRKQHRQETEKKLSTVLNSEQMEKFKAFRQQCRHNKAKKFKR